MDGGYTRDTAMAENLLWWLNGPLKDRKVVVWAHNYHVMNDFPFNQVNEETRKSSRGPMGRFLKAALGSDLYTIGFTSFAGAYLDLEAGKEVPVEPGALETVLNGVDRTWFFLDYSHLLANHWFRQRADTAAFYFNKADQTRVIAWSRIYDGIFFIKVQKPATPLK
jgi:erythromycin esterase